MSEQPSPRRRPAWRVMLPAALLSLLAHTLAISNLPDLRSAPLPPPMPLAARLVDVAPPPAAKPNTPRQNAAKAPLQPGAAQKEPSPAPAEASLPQAVPPAIQNSPQAEASEARGATETLADTASAPVAEAVNTAPTPLPEPVEAAKSPANELPLADPPPAATLRYAVVGTDPRKSPPTQAFGSGTLIWQHASGRYSLDLEASLDVLFVSINVLASRSLGSIESTGLAPSRYTETPRRRPMVATNFNRDPTSPLINTITFSASPASHPLAPAAQDRLSVIFQLAALLRGNPDKAAAGQTIKVFVAGVRGDAETWNFVVKGNETIEAADVNMQTLHVQRLPRADSNDRSIDIWYAMERGGYPARIRYTEANGSRIDLLLKG